MPKSKSITLRNLNPKFSGEILRLKTIFNEKTASGAIKAAISDYVKLKDEVERLNQQNMELKAKADILNEKLNSCTETIRRHLLLSQSMEELTKNMKGLITSFEKNGHTNN